MWGRAPYHQIFVGLIPVLMPFQELWDEVAWVMDAINQEKIGGWESSKCWNLKKKSSWKMENKHNTGKLIYSSNEKIGFFSRYTDFIS